MRGWPALLAVALAACSHRASEPPKTAPHYVVGSAYQLGGTWSYPLEQFRYDATGLAERLPNRTGQTADGELVDPTSMTGAHRTLQLPAIVDVTNLENGRQIRIRLNDRGPVQPGRLVGLSRRAADLLGMGAGAVPVRVELDQAASEGLRDRLGGAPRGITAAPVAGVVREELSAPGRPPPRSLGEPDVIASTSYVPFAEQLPETVRTVPVMPGQLWVLAGRFTGQRYAQALKNKLASLPTRMVREGGGRAPGLVVFAGPFASVAAADAGLDQVRAAGVTDASIVVE